MENIHNSFWGHKIVWVKEQAAYVGYSYRFLY